MHLLEQSGHRLNDVTPIRSEPYKERGSDTQGCLVKEFRTHKGYAIALSDPFMEIKPGSILMMKNSQSNRISSDESGLRGAEEFRDPLSGTPAERDPSPAQRGTATSSEPAMQRSLGHNSNLLKQSQSTPLSGAEGLVQVGSDRVPRSAGSLSIAERGVTPQKLSEVKRHGYSMASKESESLHRSGARINVLNADSFISGQNKSSHKAPQSHKLLSGTESHKTRRVFSVGNRSAEDLLFENPFFTTPSCLIPVYTFISL